jgi:UDP-glucose 4-epimerase
MKPRALLLGGSGFIGSALAPKLAAEGWEIAIGGRGADLKASLEGCTAVVHLACCTHPGSSRLHPLMERENLECSLDLMEALQSRPDTHLVFLSSGGALYGNPRTNPVAEDTAAEPLSFHAAGKAAVEAFITAHRAAAHPATILRIANAYGPGQALTQGFGFIRTLLEHARSGQPLEVWGDGETVRDFVFIDDVTEAIARALARPETSGTWNIGSGVGHSLNQAITLAREITRQSIPINYRAARQSDVRGVVLDISRARLKLGWAPKIALEEGLQKSWEWRLNAEFDAAGLIHRDRA